MGVVITTNNVIQTDAILTQLDAKRAFMKHLLSTNPEEYKKIYGDLTAEDIGKTYVAEGYDDGTPDGKIGPWRLFDGTLKNTENLVLIRPNELCIEFDDKPHDSDSTAHPLSLIQTESSREINKIIPILKQQNTTHYITSHGGKSPHLIIKLEGLENCTADEQRLSKQYAIKKILELSKFKSDIIQPDFTLTGKHLISMPYKKHFKPKYNGAIEEVIAEYKGTPLKVSEEEIKLCTPIAEAFKKQNQLLQSDEIGYGKMFIEKLKTQKLSDNMDRQKVLKNMVFFLCETSEANEITEICNEIIQNWEDSKTWLANAHRWMKTYASSDKKYRFNPFEINTWINDYKITWLNPFVSDDTKSKSAVIDDVNKMTSQTSVSDIIRVKKEIFKVFKGDKIKITELNWDIEEKTKLPKTKLKTLSQLAMYELENANITKMPNNAREEVDDLQAIDDGAMGGITIFHEYEDADSNHERTILAHCADLEILKAKHFNTEKTKIPWEDKTIVTFSINRDEKVEIEIYECDAENNHALTAATMICKLSETTQYRTLLPTYTKKLAIFMKNRFLDVFSSRQKSGTTTSGYGMYLDGNELRYFTPQNAKLVLKTESNIFSDLTREEREFYATEIKPDEIKTWLELISSIPQKSDNKKIMYNMVFLSLASVFRPLFFDLGLNIFPDVALSGPRSEGKTTVYGRKLVNDLWGNTIEVNSQDFEGGGFRLKYVLGCSTRPIYCDDAESLFNNNKTKGIIKVHATARDGANIRRGTKSQNMSDDNACRPIFMSGNKVVVSDPAERDRLYVIPVPKGSKNGNKKLSNTEFVRLSKIAPQVGRAVIDLVEKKELTLPDIKRIVDSSHGSERIDNIGCIFNAGKMIYLKLCEKYAVKIDSDVEKIELFEQTNEEVLAKDKTDASIVLWKILREELPYEIAEESDINTGNVSTTKIRKRLSLLALLKRLDDIDRDFEVDQAIEKWAEKGIYYDKNNEALVFHGKAFLGYYNLLAKYPIRNFKDLEESLKQSDDYDGIEYKGGDTTITVISREIQTKVNEPKEWKTKVVKCGLCIPLSILIEKDVEQLESNTN